MKLAVKGLEPTTFYNMYLKAVPADPNRYQYIRSKWHVTGLSDIAQDERRQSVLHLNSPNSGFFWTENPVSFAHVKITNHDTFRPDTVSRLHLILLRVKQAYLRVQ